MESQTIANSVSSASVVVPFPKADVMPSTTSSHTIDPPSTIEQCKLLSLPDELLLFIIDGLSHDRRSQCSLARTCSRLSPLTESKLYKSILLLSGRTAASLTSSLKAKPCRTKYISNIDMRIRPASVENMQLLTPQLMAMEKLKNLIIESPYCNTNSWDYPESDRWQNDISEYVEIFRAASLLAPPKSHRLLPMLQSFKLISNGLREEFWDLGHLNVIFLHPSLRDVHLASANIHLKPYDDGYGSYTPYSKSTLLKNLILEECHVSSEGLKAILSLPKALQRLTIEETNFSIEDGPIDFTPVSAHPEDLIAALEQQKDSLEFLRHVPTNRITTRSLPLASSERRSGFSDFTQLSCIDIVATSVLRFLLQHDLAPPNLKKLRLESRDKLHNIDKFLLTHPSNIAIKYAKDLKSLFDIDILIWGISPLANSIWPICSQIREIHRLALELSAKGKHLSLFVNQGPELNFVPPYLYGEKLPKEVFVYDQNYAFEHWSTPMLSFKGLAPDHLTDDLLAKFNQHTWRKLSETFEATLSEDDDDDDDESEESDWMTDEEIELEYHGALIEVDPDMEDDSDSDVHIGDGEGAGWGDEEPHEDL